MTSTARTVDLKEIYCPSCFLSTRADVDRCLHCGKKLSESIDSKAARDRSQSVGPTLARRRHERQ